METLDKPRPKLSLAEASDEVLIAKFVQLRDARAANKKAFELADAGDKMKQEKIEAELLRRLNERGTDSTSSRTAGTAYRLVRTSCTVADWETFFTQFVQANEAWDFLERRANKTMVEAFRQEHGDLPPGLNWSETATIGVKRG